jgi:hypothetical protein
MRRTSAAKDLKEMVELVEFVRGNLDDLLEYVSLQHRIVDTTASPAELDAVDDKVVVFCAYAFRG